MTREPIDQQQAMTMLWEHRLAIGMGSAGCFLGLEDDGGPALRGVSKAHGLSYFTVLSSELVKGSEVQCPHRTRLNADRLPALHNPLEAEVALLHLGIGLSTELGNLVGACLQAQVAAILSETEFPIYHHDPIIRPFNNSTNGAGSYTGWLPTVTAGQSEPGHEDVGELSLLNSGYPYPVHRPGIYVVPILAGYVTGVAPRASCLIKVKPQLHGRPPYAFSTSTNAELVAKQPAGV